MRVIVDQSRCQGHAVCSMTAPEIFVPDDDAGHAQVVVDTWTPALVALARKAAIGCPEQAICIVDGEAAP